MLPLHGVSKKFGESYQKTNKTKDANIFSSLSFKMVVISYNKRLTTFVQLRNQSTKASCGIDRRTAVTRSLMAFTCTFDGRLLVPAFVALCRWLPERGSSSVVSFPSRKRKYIFCARLPPVHLHHHFMRLCCSFPQFVAELVYTLLHCAVTLPLTLTTFNWPQSVYTAGHMQSMLCVYSPHVSKHGRLAR